MESSDVLFTIPGIGLHVTSEVTTMWGIILVLVVLALIIRKNLRQEDPGKLQNAAELAVEKLRNFFGDILGPERTTRFFPLFATLFIFIICCNYSGLLPGAGEIPGFKAVEGRGSREWTDQDAALIALQGSGVPEAMLYERKPLTLAAIEKVVGKKEFAQVVGQYVQKNPGKPTLVPETDKRPAITSVDTAFREVPTE